MNEIIIFLVIFAAAGIIARLGHATLFSRFLIAPTFATLGILLSQNGFGVLKPSTLAGLDLFTQVTISWLAFLLGLRRLAYVNARFEPSNKKIFQIIITFLVTLALTIGIIYFFPIDSFLKQQKIYLLSLSIFIASLLIGRESIFSVKSRINSFHATYVAIFGSLLFLFFTFEQIFNNYLEALLPFAAGCIAAIICALIQLLFLKSEKNNLQTLSLTFIAMCTLLSGISIWFLIPHLLPAFLFGFLISFSKDCAPYLRSLFLSEQSIRIVLMLLIGAHIKIAFTPIIAGILLGLLIYLSRLFIHMLMGRFFKQQTFFSAFVGSGEVAVMFVASIYFVIPEHRALLNDLLLFILAAASIGDILGVLRWLLMLQKRKNKKQKLHIELEL